MTENRGWRDKSKRLIVIWGPMSVYQLAPKSLFLPPWLKVIPKKLSFQSPEKLAYKRIGMTQASRTKQRNMVKLTSKNVKLHLFCQGSTKPGVSGAILASWGLWGRVLVCRSNWKVFIDLESFYRHGKFYSCHPKSCKQASKKEHVFERSALASLTIRLKLDKSKAAGGLVPAYFHTCKRDVLCLQVRKEVS